MGLDLGNGCLLPLHRLLITTRRDLHDSPDLRIRPDLPLLPRPKLLRLLLLLVLPPLFQHLLSMSLQRSAHRHKAIVLMNPPDDLAQVRFVFPVDDAVPDEKVDDEEGRPVSPFLRDRVKLGEYF